MLDVVVSHPSFIGSLKSFCVGTLLNKPYRTVSDGEASIRRRPPITSLSPAAFVNQSVKPCAVTMSPNLLIEAEDRRLRRGLTRMSRHDGMTSAVSSCDMVQRRALVPAVKRVRDNVGVPDAVAPVRPIVPAGVKLIQPLPAGDRAGQTGRLDHLVDHRLADLRRAASDGACSHM
jgi:hypothetical protein